MFNISMHRRDYFRYSHKSSVRQQKHQHKLTFDNIVSRRRQIKRKDQSVYSGGESKRIKYSFDEQDDKQDPRYVMCRAMFLMYMLVWGVPIYYALLLSSNMR